MRGLMLLSEIQVAVFSRVTNANGLLPTILDKKGDGSFKPNDQPYATLAIVPLDNSEPVYSDSVMRSGFILINIFAPDGYGTNEPTKQAEKFVALFPEDLKFDGITIPDLGNIRGAKDDDRKGWFYIPTLIYFEAR